MARAAGQRVHAAWLNKMIGQSVAVLVERDGNGYTENYLPVRVNQPDRAGTIITGMIQGKEDNVLVF